MQSGAPTFGTPEAALAIYGAGQLARRMNMPFRTGGSLCASKVPDAQAAYESAQTLLPTLFAGANFVLHAAGWMEGGLSASYEKFVMDFDQLGAMHVLAKGVDWSENGQAMEAFHQVEPGGISSAARIPRRISRPRSIAPTSPTTIRSSNGWRKAPRTRRPAPTRCGRRCSPTIEPPPIDPGVDEALRGFVEKKKASMPDANY